MWLGNRASDGGAGRGLRLSAGVAVRWWARQERRNKFVWVGFGFGAWCLGGVGSKVGLELGTQGSECTEGVWDVSIASTEALGLRC